MSSRLSPIAVLAMLLLVPVAHAEGDPGKPAMPGTGDYLRRMDANGDGKVQLAEYQDWLCHGFDQMDRNHDGMLSPDEQPGGKGPVVTRAAHRQRLAEQFRKQDRNRDGVLDVKELAAPPR